MTLFDREQSREDSEAREQDRERRDQYPLRNDALLAELEAGAKRELTGEHTSEWETIKRIFHLREEARS